MSGDLRLRSVLQCPHCGFKWTERMPAGACVIRQRCEACGRDLCASGGLCVFCRHGSVPGVPAQRGECARA